MERPRRRAPAPDVGAARRGRVERQGLRRERRAALHRVDAARGNVPLRSVEVDDRPRRAVVRAHLRPPVTIARCGNIYGPGDLNWSRIVPGTFRSILRGEQPVLRSDGTFLRDYLHVDDVVSRVPRARRRGRATHPGRAYNFSDESPASVLEIYAACCVAAGVPGPRAEDPRRRPWARSKTSTSTRRSRARELKWQADVEPRRRPRAHLHLVPGPARHRRDDPRKKSSAPRSSSSRASTTRSRSPRSRSSAASRRCR